MQNNKFSTIVRLLLILATFSSVSIGMPVACFESDGQVNLETGCQNIDSSTNSANQSQEDVEHCQACVDIPLWQFSPKINKYISSDIQNITSHTSDIISYIEFDEELHIVNDDYALHLIVPFEQPHLAIVTTRLLL